MSRLSGFTYRDVTKKHRRLESHFDRSAPGTPRDLVEPRDEKTHNPSKPSR
jgi:hypothetical protein